MVFFVKLLEGSFSVILVSKPSEACHMPLCEEKTLFSKHLMFPVFSSLVRQAWTLKSGFQTCVIRGHEH